jgi:outer membrane immunogenic protein
MRIKEMKTKLWLAVMMLASLYTTTAAAEMAIGVKGGKIDYDVEGTDPGLNGSLQLAFDIFDLGLADIAIEGEYSTSLTDGEIDFGPATLDTSFESMAVYASLRTAGPVYVIARVGYANTEVEVEGFSEDDTGIATGLGVGFSMGLRMEIEYTKYEPEFDTLGDFDVEYLTLGFAF